MAHTDKLLQVWRISGTVKSDPASAIVLVSFKNQELKCSLPCFRPPQPAQQDRDVMFPDFPTTGELRELVQSLKYWPGLFNFCPRGSGINFVRFRAERTPPRAASAGRRSLAAGREILATADATPPPWYHRLAASPAAGTFFHFHRRSVGERPHLACPWASGLHCY